MKYDEIHYWTEVKLDIVKEYAQAYSTILSAQKRPLLYHVYIDAFAGAGLHVSKSTGQLVSGSPLNALLIEPPFREYHLIIGDVVSNCVFRLSVNSNAQLETTSPLSSRSECVRMPRGIP